MGAARPVKGLGRTNVRKLISVLVSGAALLAQPAVAQTNMSSDGRTYKDGTTKGASSARRSQERAERNIPTCTRKLGSVAIVEPDTQWWRELNLGSPEAILKVFIQQSGCFTIVNRGRSMANRNMERAMADQGELQTGSNLGKGQVKAADYFLQPDIVTANRNSGGGGAGAALGAVGGLFGGFGRAVGGLAGGINVKKGEATVTLSVVNARTTEEEALTQGYARKTDVGFGGGAGYGWMGGFAAAGGAGYQDTAIGQIIVLAYLDAYTKLVTELGGLPTNAAAAAPIAR
jgi:curli biogenesis system outer membrane secretion channel CsgG